MDTSSPQRAYSPDEYYEERGIGAWLRRNPWLLVRLFMVMVFTFGASTTAANFSYGLIGKPKELSAEQISNGRLPPGTRLGDYVEIRGTPEFGKNFEQFGTPESEIGVSARYEVAYFYFRLKETGDNLLIQTSERAPGTIQGGAPDTRKDGERVFRGKLENVGTVIFHNTTQRGLRAAGLPQGEHVAVVEIGETPQYYRQIFPAYSAIIVIWLVSVAWLVWKRNKPFAGL